MIWAFMIPIAIVSMVAIIPLLRFALAKMRTTHSTVVSTPPAGATAPVPAGATTTTTSSTTSKWWGWTGSWWGKIAIAFVMIAIILFGGPIFLWLASFDWTITPTGAVVEDNFGRGTSAWMPVLLVVAILIVVALFTGAWGKAKKLASIPFIPLLWVLVVGFVLIQIGTGLNNWLSRQTERRQVVEFSGLNTSNVLRQPPRTISIGPMETWTLITGTIRGANPHPDWYWVCPTSSLSLLQGRVFQVRNIGYNRYEYQLTSQARVRLVEAGVQEVTVTHSYQVGRQGRRSPCDQEVL